VTFNSQILDKPVLKIPSALIELRNPPKSNPNIGMHNAKNGTDIQKKVFLFLFGKPMLVAAPSDFDGLSFWV
jgi:hypothetical protein